MLYISCQGLLAIPAGNVEQGGIGKNTIKSVPGQFQTKKLLMKNQAACVLASHAAKYLAAVQAYWRWPNDLK